MNIINTNIIIDCIKMYKMCVSVCVCMFVYICGCVFFRCEMEIIALILNFKIHEVNLTQEYNHK